MTTPDHSPPWFGLVRGAVLTLAFCSIVTPQPVSNPQNELKDVRVWSAGEVTRVALETSAEAKLSYSRLDNPDRIFVDLVDTRPEASKGSIYVIPVEDGLVRQIRVAMNEKRVTRVVLDLHVPVGFRLSQLANPERVLLELSRQGTLPPQPVPQPPPSNIRTFVPPPARAVRFVPFTLTEPPPVIASSPRVGSLRVHGPVVALPPPLAKGKPQPPVAAGPVQPSAISAKSTPPPEEISSLRAPVLIPSPAQQPRTGDQSLTRVLGLKLRRVVIDPGHGGIDQGTSGKGGLTEKELVLDVALRLGALLEERLGADVVYTRSDDTYVALEERTNLANQHKADLFLSIHANASSFRSAAGVESYYLGFTSLRADRELAARENAASQRGIHDLAELIRKIASRDKADESREFASRLQSSAQEVTAQGPGKFNRGVKQAQFAVLIGAEMPSVLTEIGFLSNPLEESLLRRPDHRQKIAEALYKGIYQYAQTLSHFRVASAPSATPVR